MNKYLKNCKKNKRVNNRKKFFLNKKRKLLSEYESYSERDKRLGLEVGETRQAVKDKIIKSKMLFGIRMIKKASKEEVEKLRKFLEKAKEEVPMQ